VEEWAKVRYSAGPITPLQQRSGMTHPRPLFVFLAKASDEDDGSGMELGL